MITYFVVQSFDVNRKRQVQPDQPILAQSESQALRMAERLAERKTGVVAFSRTGDPSTGDYEDAIILAAYGYVPLDADDVGLIPEEKKVA